jgi:hypothetical protein
LVVGRVWAIVDLLPSLLRRRPQLAWKVISHKLLRPLVPVAMLLAALSSLPLAIGSYLMRLIVAIQAVFYGAAALGWLQERRGRRSKLLYLPYYFCRVNIAQLQGLARARNRAAAVTYSRPQRAERQLVGAPEAESPPS